MNTAFLRSLSSVLAATLGLLATLPSMQEAKAQEIQLTGPLAGAPAVRKLRLYREGRFEIAPTASFTLLDEYRRTILVGARLQYNLADWIGVGVWGGFGAASLSTDLTDKISAQASSYIDPQNKIPSPNVAPNGGFSDQTGRIVWIANPQITLVPFRGKLSLFEKIFVDADAYFHVGGALIGLEERAECGGTAVSCSDPASFKRASRMAFAPSFGLGLTFYPSDLISFGFEYKAVPFSWNRAGFDSRGGGPDGKFPSTYGTNGQIAQPKVDADDRSFKFNQMASIFVGFSLGGRSTKE